MVAMAAMAVAAAVAAGAEQNQIQQAWDAALYEANIYHGLVVMGPPRETKLQRSQSIRIGYPAVQVLDLEKTHLLKLGSSAFMGIQRANLIRVRTRLHCFNVPSPLCLVNACNPSIYVMCMLTLADLHGAGLCTWCKHHTPTAAAG